MRVKVYISVVLCCAMSYLSSCDAKADKYADKVVSLLHKKGFNTKNFTHAVIIPEAGCGGCISEAEHFFQEYKEESMLFVFTKVYSEKELRLRLGNQLNRKNVVIDKEELFIAGKEEINIYPIIIDIRDEENLEWRFLEPGVSYQEVLVTLGK